MKRRQKLVEQVEIKNLTTGEVATTQLSVEAPLGPKLYNWILLFEKGLLHLSECDLTKSQFRLTYYCLSKADYINEVAIDFALLFFHTGIARKNANREINRLVDVGILIPHRKHNSETIYLLNPLIAWKGAAKRFPNMDEILATVPDEWHHNPRNKYA